jgi:hypothetical protein
MQLKKHLGTRKSILAKLTPAVIAFQRPFFVVRLPPKRFFTPTIYLRYDSNMWITTVENFVEKAVGSFGTRLIHKQHPFCPQASQQDIFLILCTFLELSTENMPPNNNTSQSKEKKINSKNPL